MVEAALVDIGNVLLKLRRNPVDAVLSASAGDVVRESFFQLYCCFESGVVSEEEFISRGMDIAGFEGSSDEFAEAWCDIFGPMPDVWAWCERRKAEGMRLVLFSNTNSLHKKRFFQESVFSLFDSAVYSDEVGEMKPGKGMYEYAVNVLKLNPSRTLYVDDLEENVEAGRRFGFRALRFLPDDPMRSLAEMDDLCR